MICFYNVLSCTVRVSTDNECYRRDKFVVAHRGELFVEADFCSLSSFIIIVYLFVITVTNFKTYIYQCIRMTTGRNTRWPHDANAKLAPHLVCFENRIRSRLFDSATLISKVDEFERQLNSLLSEAGDNSALRAAGLTRAKQFTLMFVLFGNVSNDVLKKLRHRCSKKTFNIVLLDREGLTKHLGETFEPTIWLYEEA